MSEHHSFNVSYAAKYGVESAIIIQHFIHWIGVNKRLKRNNFDGRTWSYQTLEEMEAQFPYWSKSQIYDIIEKLCTGKSRKSKSDELCFDPVLVKGNYNKTLYDRTIWYAFSIEENFTFLGNPKIDDGQAQSRNCGTPTPIPDTIPDTKPDAVKKEASLRSASKESNPASQHFSNEKKELASLREKAMEDITHETPIDLTERKEMMKLMSSIKIKEEDGTISELTEVQQMQILRQYSLDKLQSATTELLSLLMKGKKIEKTIPFFFGLLKTADPVKDECLVYLKQVTAKYNLKVRFGDCFVCDTESRDLVFTGKSLERVKKEFYEIFLKPMGVPYAI